MDTCAVFVTNPQEDVEIRKTILHLVPKMTISVCHHLGGAWGRSRQLKGEDEIFLRD